MKHAKFLATLSDNLREVSTPIDIEILQGIVQRAVDTIASDREIVKSLKTFSPGGASPRRQIDIRPHGERSVALKLFIGWDRKHNLWHVLVEGALETWVEDRIVTLGAN